MANLLQHTLNNKYVKVSRISPENSRPKACYFPNIELNIQPQKFLGVPLKIAGRRPAIFSGTPGNFDFEPILDRLVEQTPLE